MAGLLDGLTGDNTTQDQYGQTQADRRDPIWSGLIRAGLLAVAGGGNIMPEQRSAYLAQAGGALADIPKDMQQAASVSAQQKIRGQQLKAGQQKLDAQAKMSALSKSPEFADAVSKLDPAEKMMLQAALDAGDMAHASSILMGTEKTKQAAAALDLKRAQAEQKMGITKVNPDGSYTLPDGSIINAFGQMVVGPGGKFVPPNQRTTPTAAPPAPSPAPPEANSPDIEARTRAADKEIAGFSSYGTPEQPKPPVPTTGLYAPSKFTNLNMDALKKIEAEFGPQVAQQVRDFAEYRNPLPISTRKGDIVNPNSMTAQMLDMVKRVNPDWTSADFTNRNKMVNEYLISGKAKNNIDALNTAYGHIGDLYDTFKALQTGDSQVINAATNALSEKMGGAKIVDAKTAGEAVAHELASVFRAQGMSVSEIDEWKKMLSSNMSPAQMQAVIERAVHLMQARVDTHTKDWTNVMGPTPVQFFNPDRIKKIEEIKANPIGGKAAAAAPTGGPTLGEGEKNLGQLSDGGWKIQKPDGSIVVRH